MIRPIDQSIKSNIKCEHCLFHIGINCHFDVHGFKEVNYWNKCDNFKWRIETIYKDNNR